MPDLPESDIIRPATAGGRDHRLVVAVTGATGTIGLSVMRALEREPGVGRVIALARRPFDSSGEGWHKAEYRQVDVRDAEGIGRALADVDVVVHLAFSLYGASLNEDALYEINVRGTGNVARAARDAGVKRFVYTSSAAVYGFESSDAKPLSERSPIRAAGQHFYERHKAQAEVLIDRTFRGSDTAVWIFRPCAVIGPNSGGAAFHGKAGEAVRDTAALTAGVLGRVGLRLPLPAPPVPLQFVHQDDVADAILLAVTGEGEPGVYNLSSDGMVPGTEVVRRLGFWPIPFPGIAMRGLLTGVSKLPKFVPGVTWSGALVRPLHVNSSRARRKLGWRPRHDSRSALDDARHSFERLMRGDHSDGGAAPRARGR